MYTYKEAKILSQYYFTRIIGEPIYKIKDELLPITEVKIENVTNQHFDVICYSKTSLQVNFFRNIRLVAEDLDLPAPSQILQECFIGF